MCQVNITSVSGTPTSPSTTDLLVQGTASECENVQARVFCQGTWITSPLLNVTNGNWSYLFVGVKCACGEGIEVEACCVDKEGNQIPGCQCDVWGGEIPCESECCLDFRDSIQIGDCDPPGKRLVTFNISFNINDPTCLPYVLFLDFGDGNISPPQVFSTLGTHTFTVSHLYNSLTTITYNAILNYTINTACSSHSIPVPLIACPPPTDCCPEVDVRIDVKDCKPDCSREVTVTTFFSPPASNCPAAFLQWEYLDSSLGFILNGPAFTTAGASPHVETHFFTSIQSPITANLNIIYPSGCPQVVRTIVIPECDSPPICPTINSFTSTVRDCVEIGDSCCRKVDFVLDAFFDLGCGNQQSPQIKVDFGDGSAPEIRNIIYGGNQQLFFDNEYCTPGNYVVTLSILHPTGCPDQTLAITIPPCTLRPAVCPELIIDSVVIADDCVDCKREVELYLKFKNPAPCNLPATFHIEWGDGDRHPNTGSITVSNSQTIIPFSHFYDSGPQTITVVVDTPSGCTNLVHNVDIPPCDDCEPCREEGCLLQLLCPIFQLMMYSGLALGILWFILTLCIPALPAQVGLIFLGIGILGLILYWSLCKCKPCGWLWLLLWKLFLGIGLMLIIFGACCNLWIYGLGLILLALIFFFIWRNQCDPDNCDILGHLSSMWISILVPAYGFIIAFPLIANCQLMIFGSISVYWLLTLIFAIIASLYLSCILNRR